MTRWLMNFPKGLDAFLSSLCRSQRSKLRRKYKKVLNYFAEQIAGPPVLLGCGFGSGYLCHGGNREEIRQTAVWMGFFRYSADS